MEQIQPAFQLYEQSFLSEKSVWYRKRPGKRTKAAPVLIQEGELNREMAKQAQLLLHSEYGRAEIAAYVEQWLGEAGVCYSEDFGLKDDKAYIMSLLVVMAGGDKSAYTVHELEGIYSEGKYSIPRLQIKRREKRP